MKYAVAVGEMFDGISFFGPFDSFDEAEVWASRIGHASTWIVQLEDPR